MFLPLMQKRRSIRRYENRPVDRETLLLMIEAALRSPSSMDNRPLEFIVVTDPKVLEALSRAKPHGAHFLTGAPLALVVCADPKKSTVWIEDASIATLVIHLAAASLGLGSCWIQIRERMHDETLSAEAYVAGVLGIPEGLRVEALVAIGHPEAEKAPHPRESLPWDKVHEGAYGALYRP